MDFINDEEEFENYGQYEPPLSAGGQFEGSEKSSDKSGFEEVSEPKMEATFKEKQHMEVFQEALNIRSTKDKPFVLLREAFLKIDPELSPKFIDDTIQLLRDNETFPYLNATYVANSRLFHKEYKGYNSKLIDDWVKNMNKRFGDQYLIQIDFLRYVLIGDWLFKRS